MLKLHTDVESILSWTGNARIDFEEECYIHKSAHVIVNLDLGAYSYIGQSCLIGSATIGRFCSIGPGVKIGLGEHDVDFLSTHPIFYGSRHGYDIPLGIGGERKNARKAPKIGDDVWIGADAIIRRGVKIGKGAVIGANCVVTKDVGPYEIWGGVPAKLIRFRFDEKTRRELVLLDWPKLKLASFVNQKIDDVPNMITYLRSQLLNSGNYANYSKGSFIKDQKEIRFRAY